MNRTGCSTRSSGSWRRSATKRPTSTACSRPCCSPTSSGPRRRPRSSATGWGDLVERHHAAVRALLAPYRGTEVDTAGDGFFATFDGPARAVRCAQAIVTRFETLGIEVRAGVHTGEVETIAGKVGGIAVNDRRAGRRRSRPRPRSSSHRPSRT